MYTVWIEIHREHRFYLISGHLFSTPGNSNLFLFPLKVQVIGSRLYNQISEVLVDKRESFDKVEKLRNLFSIYLKSVY